MVLVVVDADMNRAEKQEESKVDLSFREKVMKSCKEQTSI